MRALRFDAFGGPDVLQVEDVETPSPHAGEVLVEVHAGGLNFADTERRRGLYLASTALPDTSGFEGAGVVFAVGHGVDPSWLHRRVAFTAPRAHAEYCTVPFTKLLPLPDSMDFITGAAFPVQALTAWHVLHTLGHVAEGETVLVHSAAGGVGQLVTQLAQEAGAMVIGTVSRDGKHERARADQVLTRGPHFVERLLALSPGGVHLVLEGIGAEVAVEALRCLRPLGRWVTYGTASGAPPPLDLGALYEKSVSVSAFWLRTELPAPVAAKAAAEVMARIDDGRLQLEITTGPLEDAARAHRRLEGGLTTGKWVLRIR
ncbi:MAG: zinc-binding dehydrogenase [Archangium sp.]|nr:zinc-binding dehydrogenase [Archangium sp.]